MAVTPMSGAARPLDARLAWATVILLMAAYACAFIDRQIINLLAPAIQADFGLTDVQTSLLLGPAFALLFAVSGLFFGRLADLGNRSKIIVSGIASWSVLTALCGVAPSFAPLFAARMGVGVGEASLTPSAVSLISDIFPRERRARPLAVFNMGSNLGSGSAYLIGAAIIPAAPVVLPLLGARAPWQATFLYLGLPGLVLAGLALFIREPVRTERSTPAGQIPSGAIRYLAANIRLLAPLLVGAALIGQQGYSVAAWEASYFTRTFGWSTATIGVTLGLKVLFSAVAATLCAGWLATRLRRRGRADATHLTILAGSVLMILPSSVAWIMPSVWTVVFFSACQSFAMSFALNMVGAAVCDVVPNERRGTVFATYMLTGNLLGLGLGPLVVALFSQYVYAGQIGPALCTSGAIVTPLALLLLLSGRGAFRQALGRTTPPAS